MEDSIVISAVFMAYLLDLLLGDPSYLPHPIVYFGKMIAKGENVLNNGKHRILKGVVLVMTLLLLVFASFYGLQKLVQSQGPYASGLFVMVFFFFGLANRTLVKEGRMVFDALEQKGLEAGRQQLSRIVGRDTSELNEQQIRTAVLETMAENLSDGVVAPMFWYALLGIPGMMAYKLINTFDSMIAYKNERYIQFGRFAAILDDAVNFIPARITGLLMVLVSFSLRAFRYMFLFGNKHSSPNAGYPESALAGILDVRFGGPNIYHGKLIEKPFIGYNNRPLLYKDFKISARINHAVCLLSVIVLIVIQIYLN